jgi:hypothetical protein
MVFSRHPANGGTSGPGNAYLAKRKTSLEVPASLPKKSDRAARALTSMWDYCPVKRQRRHDLTAEILRKIGA